MCQRRVGGFGRPVLVGGALTGAAGSPVRRGPGRAEAVAVEPTVAEEEGAAGAALAIADSEPMGVTRGGTASALGALDGAVTVVLVSGVG
jgi:hypothetical protein